MKKSFHMILVFSLLFSMMFSSIGPAYFAAENFEDPLISGEIMPFEYLSLNGSSRTYEFTIPEGASYNLIVDPAENAENLYEQIILVMPGSTVNTFYPNMTQLPPISEGTYQLIISYKESLESIQDTGTFQLTPAATSPILSLSKTSHDFGNVVQGSSTQAFNQIFVQRNGKSDEPITNLSAAFENETQTIFSFSGLEADKLAGENQAENFIVSVTDTTTPGTYEENLIISANDQVPVTLTLKVTITENTQRTVVFISPNNENSNDFHEEIVVSGQTVKPHTLPQPSEGHRYDWYQKTGDEVYEVFDFQTPITQNINLYARESLIRYTVNFETNGAGSIESQSTPYGLNVILPSPPPSKEGFTFAGWYTDAAFMTAFTGDEQIYQDTTLYAKWLSQNTKLVFQRVEGQQYFTINQDTKTFDNVPFDYSLYELYYAIEAETGEEITSITYYRQDGTFVSDFHLYPDHHLDNLFVENGDYIRVVAEDTAFSQDYTINVKKAAINDTYNTNFEEELIVSAQNGILSNDDFPELRQMDSNDMHHQIELVSTTENGTLLLEDDGGFTYTPNRNFEGNDTFTYKLIQNQSNVYGREINTQDVPAYASSNTATVTITVGDAPQYTLTFNTGSVETSFEREGSKTQPVPGPTNPTRTGYNFAGWFYDQGTFAQSVVFPLGLLGDLTVHAKWNPVQYAVNFVTGSDSTIPLQMINYMENVVEPDPPVRKGYTFMGWQSNGSEFSFSTPVTSHITLTAVWEINTYTVTFDSREGTGIPAQQIQYGSSLTTFENPTREGYTFDGWYTSLDYTEQFNLDSSITADVTVYAKWLSQNSKLELRYPENQSNFNLNVEDELIENASFTLTFQQLMNALKTVNENATKIEVLRGEENLGCIYENYGMYTINAMGCMDYDLLNQFIKDGDILRVTAEDVSSEYQTEYTIEVMNAAADDTYQTNYRTQLTVSSEEGVLANDTYQANVANDFRINRLPEPSGEFAVEVVTTTPNGTLTMEPDGSFSYLPNVGFSGVDTFTYRISYSVEPIQYGRSESPTEKVYSNEATVRITVGPRPAPPTPPSDGEIIVVDEDNPTDILIRLLINRQLIGGLPTDLITMDPDRVLEALRNLDQSTSRVIVPERPDNPVTQLTIPFLSIEHYLAYQKNLSIQVPYVELMLRNSQLREQNDQLLFRFQQQRDAQEQQRLQAMMEAQKSASERLRTLGLPVIISPNVDLEDTQVALPIPADYAVERDGELRVFVLHSDGTTEWLPVEIRAGKAYFITPSFSTFTLVAVQEEEVEEGGLPYIRGFEDKTFRPGLAVTRHQIAAMFARKLSGNTVPVTQATFTDTRSSWAKNEIEYVRANGIMNGVSATMFNPTAPMTRAQIAVTADRYLQKVCGMDMASSSYCGNMSMGKGYSDVRDGEWGAASIKRMQALGIITGFRDGTFRAGDHVTRAQIVTIINRLFEMTPADSYATPSFTDVSPRYWAYEDIERATRGK